MIEGTFAGYGETTGETAVTRAVLVAVWWFVSNVVSLVVRSLAEVSVGGFMGDRGLESGFGRGARSGGARRAGGMGFTLVELLVVIGVIAILIGMLLPALTRVRQQSVALKCMSNMRTLGQYMANYAVGNKGWLFPPRSGQNVALPQRWMVSVIKMDKLPDPPTDEAGDYTPKVMFCPADVAEVVWEPSGLEFVKPGQTNVHSYVLSLNLGDERVTFSRHDLGGLTPGTLAIMGEKVSVSPAYYLGTRPQDPSDYRAVLEFYRHGRPGKKGAGKVRGGSNYLFLDLHVEAMGEIAALRALDPWNFMTLTEGSAQ